MTCTTISLDKTGTIKHRVETQRKECFLRSYWAHIVVLWCFKTQNNWSCLSMFHALEKGTFMKPYLSTNVSRDQEQHNMYVYNTGHRCLCESDEPLCKFLLYRFQRSSQCNITVDYINIFCIDHWQFW